MLKFNEKSHNSFNAGKILQKEGFFDNSIHVFYYSCLQQLLKILTYNLNKSEDSILNEIKKNKKGSHNYYINNVFSDCNKIQKNKKKCFTFKKLILELKKLRVTADYKSILITKQESHIAGKTAQKILDILKEVYGSK